MMVQTSYPARCTSGELVKVLLSSYLLLARTTHGYMVNGDPNRRADFLDPKEKYHLEWTVDWSTNRISFNVKVKTYGWILFGLAKNKMDNSPKDMVIGGVKASQVYFSDRHEKGNGGHVAILDKRQDYRLENAWEKMGETFLRFSREISLDTCDSEDYPITDDKLTIIWAYSDSDNYDGHKKTPPHKRGSYEVYLLDPDFTPEILRNASGRPKLARKQDSIDETLHTWTISVRSKLSSAHTSYLCSLHKAPRLPRKHHIVGYHVFPQETKAGHVHHFTVLKCNAPQTFTGRNLFERFAGAPGESCLPGGKSTKPQGMQRQFCGQLYAAWGLGGRPFFFPPQAGLPLGEDPDEYYLVETHFDNPQRKVNVLVSFQIDFWYTPQLRPSDAGMMSIGVMVPGLPPTILVPPKTTGHRIFGHCSAECTFRFLPDEGITVFAGLFHGHNNAVQMKLRHFDMSKKAELPWIMHDDNYNSRFQQMRLLLDEVGVLPGDVLSVECTYENIWANSTITAGLSSSQETCSSFVYYYNQIADFSFCRSQIVTDAGRRHFLRGLDNVTWDNNKIDWVATSPRELAGQTVTEITHRVSWDRALKTELQRFHETFPQTGSCSRDLFTRYEDSIRRELEARGGMLSAYLQTELDTEDDYIGIVKNPFFGAKSYSPLRITCPTTRKG